MRRSDYPRIMALPDGHAVKQHVLAHSAFCRECVGFEIDYKNEQSPPSDVAWFSLQEHRSVKLSDLFYSHFAFTPNLDDWMSASREPTKNETFYLSHIEETRKLLCEAKSAAADQHATAALEMIEQAQFVLHLWQRSILKRLDGEYLEI